MKPPPPPTIEEFAKTLKRKSMCRVCASPARERIEQAYANGVPGAHIARWFETFEPDSGIAEAGVARHFLQGHHGQAK